MTDQVFFLVGSELLFWLTAALFLRPLRKKPDALVQGLCLAAVGFALQLACGFAAMQIAWLKWMFYPLHVALALGFFWLCAEGSFSGDIFGAIWTVMGHQFGMQLCGMVYGIALESGAIDWLARPCAMLLAALPPVVCGLTIARWMPVKGRYDIGPRQLSATLLSFLVFEMMALLAEGSWLAGTLWNSWGMIIMVELYCATLVYLQHEMFKKSAMRHEIELLNRMQEQQRRQYDLAKENIAIINRKCHDLKHQMQAMRILFQDENREKYLQEVEGAVRIYEAIAKTGNEVLDTVLTEKSLICEANSIQAHCVADGRLLDFMDPVDLYTIFGNALDNAIESVKNLEQTEKRIIDVLVYQENQFKIIQIINPVEGQLHFNEEGLPMTTKENNGYHGFGLKSIRHTVKKYGGFLTVNVEKGCFYLRVLLPVQQPQTAEAAI